MSEEIEIKSTTVTHATRTANKKPPLPVGTPLQKRVATEPDPFMVAFEAKLKEAEKLNDVLTNELMLFMADYVLSMAPGVNIDLRAGAAKQKAFFKMLQKVIEKSTIDTFKTNWIIVLSYFWAYRRDKALGERYVNRFSEYWQNKDEDLTAYQRIVNLCLLSANPAERSKVLKQVDINKTLEIGFTEVGRNNVKTFYKA